MTVSEHGAKGIPRADWGWPALMSKAIVAAYVSFSERWIEQRLSAGEFPPPVRFGDSPRWRKADIDNWLENL